MLIFLGDSESLSQIKDKINKILQKLLNVKEINKLMMNYLQINYPNNKQKLLLFTI